MSIECKLCGKEFKNKIQYRHLKSEHDMTIKQYELQFGKGSTDLNYKAPELAPEEQVTCMVCDDTLKNLITNSHLKAHGMTVAQYREQYGDDALYSSSYRESKSIRMKGEKNPNFGNTWTDDMKQNLSEKLSGRETWNKGVPVTEEQKRKQSLTMKEKYASGKIINARKGTTHTEEAKQKLSEAQVRYASENKEEMSERGKQSFLTMKEKYGDEYVKEHQQRMIDAITPETRIRMNRTLVEANERKSKASLDQLGHIMKTNGYDIISIEPNIIKGKNDKRITYICPNGKLHNNVRGYFKESLWVDKNSCRMCMPKNSSRGELELRDYIDSLGVMYEANNCSIIWPYEVDILIPDHKLAIEYNGLYWHSEQMGKDEYYHEYKRRLLEDKGYQLIHVFEDEFQNKKDIVKSIISQKLKKNTELYHARKLIVTEISKQESKDFFNANHLYGNGASNVSLALKNDEGEILSVMSFKKDAVHEWEIKRLCTKVGCNIRGGSSKLFNAFVNNYRPTSIMSYSDKRFSLGNVYNLLGFKYSEDTIPTKWFFKNTGNLLTLRRVNWRYIIQRYKGVGIIDQAFNDGWYLIYDCGHAKWVWTP